MAEPSKALNNRVLVVVSLFAITILACSIIEQGTSSSDVEATIAAGVAGTQQAVAVAQATIEAAVVATQAAQGQSNVQPAANDAAQSNPPVQPQQPDTQEIVQIVSKEVNALVGRDMATIQSVFTPNAIIIDRNGTPNNSDDDIIWNGWPRIEQRYRALFAGEFTTLTLVGFAVEFVGDRAIASYSGIMVDDTLYADNGFYTLTNYSGQWQIDQLQIGRQIGYSFLIPQDDGLYVLELGNQHRYEEPWGWDKGDPCKAWQNNDWDDTKPDYRGFNIELLLTNYSEEKIPDNWPVQFLTANDKSVRACFYGYKGSGPRPGATSSVTFFTVVEKGDYVDRIIFEQDGQTLTLCLDGLGDWWRCEDGS